MGTFNKHFYILVRHLFPTCVCTSLRGLPRKSRISCGRRRRTECGLTPASRRGVAADQSRGVVDPAPPVLTGSSSRQINDRRRSRAAVARGPLPCETDRSCSHVFGGRIRGNERSVTQHQKSRSAPEDRRQSSTTSVPCDLSCGGCRCRVLLTNPRGLRLTSTRS